MNPAIGELLELSRRNDELEAENVLLKTALLKIYDPMKYHHWEEDPYTRAGCFQFVAQEALKACDDIIKKLPEDYKP